MDADLVRIPKITNFILIHWKLNDDKCDLFCFLSINEFGLVRIPW